MSISKQLYDQLRGQYIDPALSPHGFARHSYDGLRAWHGDILWEVTVPFTMARARDYGSVNLMVGVGSGSIVQFLRHCPVFANRTGHCLLDRELWDLSRNREHKTWCVEPETDLRTLGLQVIGAIDDYVLPFLRTHGSYDGMLGVLQATPLDGECCAWERLYPLSAAYWLRGEHERAIQIIDAEFDRLQDELDRAHSLANRNRLATVERFSSFLKNLS